MTALDTPDSALTLPLLLQLYDQCNLGIILLGPDRKVIIWNKWLEDASETSRDDVLGKRLNDVFPQLNNPRLSTAIDDSYAYQHSAILSPRLHANVFPLDSLRSTPDRGNKMGQMVVISSLKTTTKEHFCLIQITDVTSALSREDQLREQAQSLSLSVDERVKELAALYSLSDILKRSELSIEDTLSEAIKVFRPAWQYPEITCARITFQEFEFATKNFKETPWKLACDITVQGNKAGTVEVFYLMETPQMDEGPFLLEERNLINAASVSIGEYVERTQAKEQLLQSQKMEVVGQLTGGIAHDFNNMLMVMMGNTEMLQENVHKDPDSDKYIEALRKAIHRATSLTDRLLSFSRRQMLSPHAVNVNEVLGDLTVILQQTLGTAIAINIASTDDLWQVIIDDSQLEHALLNLAINARYAMPHGGTLSIEVANASLDDTFAHQRDGVTPGDYVKISVSDTGHGMPPEVLEKVFEPFFSTKEVGEGSGLGLSMVYGFVKQSGGHISIDSEVGHGTAVVLYLPRVRTSPVEAAPDAEIIHNTE